MGAKQNNARPLTERIWGQDWINAIPLKWRSALKYLNIKTPGVNNETLPDEIGVGGVVNSQVVTNRTNEHEKTTSKLDGSVAQHTYHDQDYDEQLDVVVPIDRYLTEEGAEFGQPRRKIEGLVPGIDSVETIGVDTSALDDYILEFPGQTTLQFPDILTGFEVLEEETTGEGSSHASPLSYGFGGDHSVTLSISSRAQASAIFTKEVVPFITPMEGVHRSTTNYMFFLPIPVTRQQVIDKLAELTGASVVSWPLFNPNNVIFVIVSRRVSLEVSGGYTLHETVSSGGESYFVAQEAHTSREVGLTIKTIRLPPTIHGNLSGSLPGGSGYSTIGDDVTATATIPDFVWASVFGWGFDVEETENAWSKVYAYNLGATSGDSALPSSGLLIVEVNARPYKYGYAMIQAEVIDASTL